MTPDDRSLLRLIAETIRLDMVHGLRPERRAELADFLDRVAGERAQDFKIDFSQTPKLSLGSIAEHDHRERGGEWNG